MKKISLYFIACALGIGFATDICAEQISEGDALRIAKEFRSGDPKLRKSANVPMTLAYVAPAAQGAAFYVFNSGDNNGFTIVSGNDVMPAVLGFSDSGSFNPENLPQNVKIWLDGYARQADFAASRREGFFRAPANDTRPDVSPIVTAEWDQDAPYYDLCPMRSGRHTYTGCVATAMAEVMHAFQWPEQARGTCRFNGSTVSLNSIYEWDRMLEKYEDGKYTAAQGNAVAQLMFDCGRSVDMSYGTSGSGALSHLMQPALINNFNYDEGVSYSERMYFQDEEWEELMYREVAAGRPILYGGNSLTVGHQFVADGYRTGGYFHINWGWSGDCNGYYLLDALAPSEHGIGGGNDNESFDYDQDAVYGVQKPAGGKRQTALCGTGSFAIGESSYPEEDMFTITRGIIFGSNNQRINGYSNFTGMDFKVYPGVRVTNMSTGEETDLKYGEMAEFKSWSTVVNAYPVNMSGVKDGKYVVYPYSFAEDGTPMLTRCPNTREGFMILEVKNGNRSYSYASDDPSFSYEALGISLDPTTVSLKKDEEIILQANVVPSYAASQQLIWTSSDESVVKVNNGVITAVESGKATVTVTTTDGSNLSASCVVTVDGFVSGIDGLEEDELFIVYDLLGNELMKDASLKALRKLPKGVYIVNGKKILL